MPVVKVRDVVLFDVENREHRKLFGMFLQKGSWSHSPVLFKTDEGGENIAIIMRKLCEYYTLKEIY